MAENFARGKLLNTIRRTKQNKMIARFVVNAIILLISVLAGEAFGSEVIRTEVVNSKTGSTGASSSSAAGVSAGSPLPTNDPNSLCLDNREYQVKDPVHFLPTTEKIKSKICPDSPGKTNLCSKWDSAEKSYTAAAKALGVPAQVLMCLTHIESTMNAGLTSSTGAKGLTQFMPATAADYQRKFNSDPEYKKAWENYRSFEGTTGNSGRFTKGHIISNSLDDSDVQIFATAMYMRDSIRNTENFWKKRVGEPPQVSGSQMTKLYHFLMISYNAGPAVGEQYIKGSLDSYRKLPKETQGYLNKFDSCINSPDRRELIAYLEAISKSTGSLN